jgi:hypothetical protein
MRFPIDADTTEQKLNAFLPNSLHLRFRLLTISSLVLPLLLQAILQYFRIREIQLKLLEASGMDRTNILSQNKEFDEVNSDLDHLTEIHSSYTCSWWQYSRAPADR